MDTPTPAALAATPGGPPKDRDHHRAPDNKFSLKAFLSYGFRPFFLLSCLFAALSMFAWLAWIGIHAAGGAVRSMTIAMAPHQWHAHEMLFGYALGVIAGFFLTAVPSWTGSKPVSGQVLGGLVTVWLLGRMAFLFSAYLPPLAVAAADLAFVPCLLALVLRALLNKWSKRNLIFLPILTAVFAANLMTHLDFTDLAPGFMETGTMLGLNAVVLLIVVLGGRVVPAFTTNALRRAGEERFPVSRTPVEMASILSMAFLVVAEITVPEGPIAGTLALFAAAANGVRLAGWRGHKVLDQPILWIIHLAYAWLVVGLAFKGAAHFELISQATALHVLTVGAVGSMTLGVMTRAGLGHTGRSLRVSPWVTTAYILISLSAAVRVAVPPLIPQYYNEGMLVAGVAWMLAYTFVTLVYWPILTRPWQRPGGEETTA